MIERMQNRFVDWGHASVPHPGHTVTGDLHLIVDRTSGPLVAVIDGLGHGRDAEQAALLAAEVMRNEPDSPLADLISRCHEALRDTRGIAVTLAEIDVRENILKWAGIGNVEGRLLRALPQQERQAESVLLRGGVVGYQIPAFRPVTVKTHPGDVLIFATDGISPSFGDDVILSDGPQRIAERIMSQHNRKTDDALVVVGKYLGASYG